jgi:hypothetical protein
MEETESGIQKTEETYRERERERGREIENET